MIPVWAWKGAIVFGLIALGAVVIVMLTMPWTADWFH